LHHHLPDIAAGFHYLKQIIMRRKILSIACFLAFIFVASFNKTSAQEFKSGDNVVSLGIGFGSSFVGYSYSNETPAIVLQYERGIWDIGGPGVISLGGYVGFKSYKYDGYYYGYSEKWNYTVIGVRSAYHFNMIKVDHLDVYAGAMLSMYIPSYTYSGPSYYNKVHYGNITSVSVYGGARYFFTDNIGAFAELGHGISYFTTGGCLKF
jgi:hypothetical protein